MLPLLRLKSHDKPDSTRTFPYQAVGWSVSLFSLAEHWSRVKLFSGPSIIIGRGNETMPSIGPPLIQALGFTPYSIWPGDEFDWRSTVLFQELTIIKL